MTSDRPAANGPGSTAIPSRSHGGDDEVLETHWQGEPLAVWESLWGIPHFEAWTGLDSTNDRARALLRESAPDWSVVVAGVQRRGRGRSGRSWQSAAGAGLWASFVVRPRAASQSALAPLLTGLALARAIEDAGDGRVGLKWPNDVLWSGRKIAGILCEATTAGIVIGVGINLREPPGGFDRAHAARAGALEPVTGRRWSEAALLGAILRQLRALWEPPVLRFDGEAAEAWARRDVLADQVVRVGAVAGRARGLTPDGALRVETPEGDIVPVRAGHVEWAPGGALGFAPSEYTE